MYQPGRAWLHDTSSTIQGILVSRVAGAPLPDFPAERIFEPLGMTDTAFHVPATKRHRFSSYYEPTEDGGLTLVDPPDGQWSAPPPLPLGNGGLVSTLDDWHAFARMLLGRGALGDRRVLSPGRRRTAANPLRERPDPSTQLPWLRYGRQCRRRCLGGYWFRPAMTPPSTSQMAPVTQLAWSESRKVTAAAMSSVVPIRPIGWKALNPASTVSTSAGGMKPS